MVINHHHSKISNLDDAAVNPAAWVEAQSVENKLITLIDSGEDLYDHYHPLNDLPLQK